ASKPSEPVKPPPPAAPVAAAATPAPRDDPSPLAAPAQPSADSSAEAPSPADRGRGLRVVGLTTLGGAAVLVGLGVYFGLQASDASTQLEQMAQQHQTWDKNLYDEGQSDQTKAIVLLGLGGAALTTGVVLSYLGWREGRVSVEPTAGGIRVACRF
ncbi:MAG TPA: hypothetical protein VKN99_25805, partial [Polyangia bacterium]|nr:hypothetical protein [Polyangia bacterium]